MTYPLPSDEKIGVLQDGTLWEKTGQIWVISWPPEQVGRYIARIAIIPPVGILSSDALELWDDSGYLSRSFTGISTGYNPISEPPFVAAGSGVYLVWGTGQGTVPRAKLFAKGILI